MDQVCPAGYKSVRWDSKSKGVELASGLYFYRFEAKSLSSEKKFNRVNKMILIKWLLAAGCWLLVVGVFYWTPPLDFKVIYAYIT